jgi:hypothetical protein
MVGFEFVAFGEAEADLEAPVAEWMALLATGPCLRRSNRRKRPVNPVA